MDNHDQQSEYVYILRCADNTLYTGWTTNLAHRVSVHNAGKGAKYTKPRRPVNLVYYEEFKDRSEAKRRECAIKKLTRAAKENLVRSMDSKQLENILIPEE